jgi:hypothetical protein
MKTTSGGDFDPENPLQKAAFDPENHIKNCLRQLRVHVLAVFPLYSDYRPIRAENRSLIEKEL